MSHLIQIGIILIAPSFLYVTLSRRLDRSLSMAIMACVSIALTLLLRIAEK